ncbi:hypothetical protein BGZ60DRAFT_235586 [Tricladium varicosporioides]|nr:hypothetical protein BGZ60DRAFT_235586 [Hymenoscyphus varicosporioides]
MRHMIDPQFSQLKSFSPKVRTLGIISNPSSKTNLNPQVTNVFYVPLSLINSPPALMAQDEDDTSDMTDEEFHSNKSSSRTTPENPLQSPSKPAWGGPSRQSSKLGRRSFRITEKQNTSSRRKSFPPSSNGQQLRGVKARPRMEINKDAEAEYIPLSRVAHNMIEKQYRTRLNMQFTNLLNALSPKVIGAEFNGKVSKGDVLVFAKRYIQALERDKKNLEGEKRKYEEDIRHLREAWVRSGGQC